MRDFNYEIFNPGGNKTALVEGLDFTKEEKKEINKIILQSNSEIEQVGFLGVIEKKLEMAGGEFCMNATRCAVWKCLNGKNGEIELSVSGCKNKVKGKIENDNAFVEIKLEQKIGDLINIIDKVHLINLPGIDFIIIDEEESEKYLVELNKNENKVKQDMKRIMQLYNCVAEAIGVILLENSKENEVKIHPIVWVKSIDTLYYETACGSGSLATAIYIKYKENYNWVKIKQPSGYFINVELIESEDYLDKAIVSGKIIKE